MSKQRIIRFNMSKDEKVKKQDRFAIKRNINYEQSGITFKTGIKIYWNTAFHSFLYSPNFFYFSDI